CGYARPTERRNHVSSDNGCQAVPQVRVKRCGASTGEDCDGKNVQSISEMDRPTTSCQVAGKVGSDGAAAGQAVWIDKADTDGAGGHTTAAAARLVYLAIVPGGLDPSGGTGNVVQLPPAALRRPAHHLAKRRFDERDGVWRMG